jgi:hypothetical protein
MYLCFRKHKVEDYKLVYPLEFSAVVLCYLIIYPLSWAHYFSMAILPVICFISVCLNKNYHLPKTTWIFLFTGYCMIAFHINSYWLMNVLGQNYFTRFIVSAPFLGASLLLVLDLWLMRKCQTDIAV